MFEDIKKIDLFLNKFLPKKDFSEPKLLDAVKYSLFSGGKRIRPILLLEFSRLCGGSDEISMPFACAIEMIHTYSLIHDDLPCMDNSDTRRGKPSNHIVFGEAIAMLAGDALLTLAFEIISFVSLSPKRVLRAINVLSECAGISGMVAGQSMDLETKNIEFETLKNISYKKTCKLMIAAAKIGCILANASEEKIFLAQNYAENFGFAFQIFDDILDFNNKEETNFVNNLGYASSRKLANDFILKAEGFLSKFNKKSEKLESFNKSLIKQA